VVYFHCFWNQCRCLSVAKNIHQILPPCELLMDVTGSFHGSCAPQVPAHRTFPSISEIGRRRNVVFLCPAASEKSRPRDQSAEVLTFAVKSFIIVNDTAANGQPQKNTRMISVPLYVLLILLLVIQDDFKELQGKNCRAPHRYPSSPLTIGKKS
jgi:hypothetical protein